MDSSPDQASNNIPADSRLICSYLGLEFDQETCFTYPSLGNHCHGVNPPPPISIVHQRTICLKTAHEQCKIFSGTWDGSVPGEISISSPGKRSFPLWVKALLILALFTLAALTIWLGQGAIQNYFQTLPIIAAIQPQKTPSVVAGILPTATLKPARSQPTHTLPPLTPSDTLAPTVTTESPAMPDTPTPTSALPTPGPGIATPFGPNKLFILYMVGEGESISNIARTYNTTVEVIKAANKLIEGSSVRPGTVLVILPSQTDLTNTTKFIVISIEENTPLATLTQEYGVSAEDIRYFNSLGTKLEIPAGRWLIIPIADG